MARVETDSDSSSGTGDSSADEVSASKHHSSHSDDESITSDDEDEASLERNADEAEKKITENPYIYSNHVDLLNILFKLGDVSRLRTVYERLSNMCPMSAPQWLRWLQIEVRVCSSVESKNQLEKLFQRAFIDCYSIHIYTEWCTVNLSNKEGEKDTQSVLSDALRLAGSDPTDGAILWDTVREFELALLYVMDTSSEKYASQVMKIFEIFKKQLSRPLLQTEKTLEEFRSFVEIMGTYIPNSEKLVKEVEDAHIVSENLFKQLYEYENKLEDESKLDSQKDETYQSYISYVKTLLQDEKLKDCDIVNLLNVLYDKMTSDCISPHSRGEFSLPNNAQKLCIEYVDFARAYGSNEHCLNVIQKVIRRYHRNSALWIIKLQQLERMKKEFKEIKAEFETSLFSGFDTAQDYVSLWLCYLEILKRYTDFTSSEQIEILRKTFRLSWDSLSQMWGDEADKEFEILQYWARIEYYHTKDFSYGEELFKEIFSYGDNNLRGGLWMEFVRLEYHRGGESSARIAFKDAVKHSPDPRLQHAWLALERDFGSLDSLVECNTICLAKASEWSEFQFKNKSNKGTSSYNDSPNKNKKNVHSNNNIKSKKRPYSKVESDDHSAERHSSKNKKISDTIHSDKMEHENGFKSSVNKNKVELNKNLKRRNDSSESSEIPLKKSKEETVSKINREPWSGDQQSSEKTSRTAFISNLRLKVDEKELQEKLSNYGAIEEIRIVTNVKSYGSICYCVYIDPKSVDVALAHDRTLFNDRPMFISRYSDKDNRKKHFTYSTEIERNKLFVKNIAFESCTKEHLQRIFEEYGELKDIRIVTHKTGKPKGLAYIDYCNEESASAALKAVDGMEVDGRCLSVAFSAPPPKKIAPSSSTTLTTSRGYARTQLFIPTVVQTSTSVNKVKSSDVQTGESASKKSKLSNTDFRNLLMGNK